MHTMNEQQNFPGTSSDFSDNTVSPEVHTHESALPVEDTVQANGDSVTQNETDATPEIVTASETVPQEVTATDATPEEIPLAQAPVDETTPSAAPADQLPEGAAASTQSQEDAAAKEAAAKEAAAARAARSEEGRRRAQENWQKLAGSKESGQVLEGTVTAAVKGGLLVDLSGFRGFLPASQVRVEKGTALDTLVKHKLPLRVIDVDEGRRRVVVSHRKALESQRRADRAELLRSLQVGDDREATVMRLTDFGAFVDLGGVDALIPMNELAFDRVEKASDVVQPGEKITVRVIRVDQGGKKIAVSRKGALPDPWRDNAETLRQGNVIEGKVVAKEPRLQVEIAPGVVGSISDREANPEDYEIGEAVEVSVRSVDWRGRRLRLSTMHHAAQTISSSGFAPLGEELKSRR
ncbi:MAG: S1 RNA-binding domain-containing protein [Candidatus Eremiobacteraeota bacterium]|nr:S1 RNA-binding domain-containing protein [Candidatus Eremiobacteraeota bacterium]